MLHLVCLIFVKYQSLLHSVVSILLASLLKVRETTQQNSVGGQKKEEEEEEDLSLAYAARGQGILSDTFFISYKLDSTWRKHFFSPWILSSAGFARYPMVGYIYKVNSTSSEEIWL